MRRYPDMKYNVLAAIVFVTATLSFSITEAYANKIFAEKGKMYRHVTGLSFWYPDTWKIQELEEAIQLIPDNLEKTAQGPSEIYFVSGESIAGTGIRKPDDPQVIQYTDEAVRSVLPMLKMKRGVTDVNVIDGKGIMLEWAGKNYEGKAIEAKAFITLTKGFAISLSAVGLKKSVEKRSETLKQIFSSFGFGEGKLDKKLVGSWTLSATQAITNQSVWETDWSRAQMVSDNQSVISFSPDGRWSRTDTSHMIVGAGGLWLEDKSRDVSAGQWFAGDGVLFLIWDNNTWEDYQYKIGTNNKGRSLRMISGKTGQIWEETR